MSTTEEYSSFTLTRTAARFPNAPAIHSDTSLGYSEFSRRVESCAARLADRHIRRGERVALLSPASTEALVLIFAALRLGAVAVPVSTRFPAAQTADLLDSIHCRTLVASADYAPLYTPALPTVYALDELLHGAHGAVPDDETAPENDATIIFTSGSTGRPKAVLHTLRAHLASALGSRHNIPFGVNDSWLLSLPLYHVGGFAIPLRAALGGAAVAVPAPGESLREALLRLPITHLSLVATQLYRLLQDSDLLPVLQRMKAILLGGSAIPRSLVDRALGAGLRIHTSYGCTEMASQITTTARPTPDELATSGRLLPYRDLRIAADGEILVRGASLFNGYVEGDALRTGVDNDGWYHTRDTGFLDDQGRLHVTGRLDNMFISGGENIQPEEIEQALCSIPDILQSLVVPVPDEEFGARPFAFLWPVDSATIDESTIRSYLAKRIARFKIPVRFVVEPPVDERTGKLSRQEYRTKAEAMMTM